MKNNVIMFGVRPTGSLHIGHYYSIINPLKNNILNTESDKIIVFFADLHSHYNIYNSVNNIPSYHQIKRLSDEYIYKIMFTLSKYINIKHKKIKFVKQSLNKEYHYQLMHQLLSFINGNELYRNPIYINQIKREFVKILRSYVTNNMMTKETMEDILSYFMNDISVLTCGISRFNELQMRRFFQSLNIDETVTTKIIQSVNGIRGQIGFSQYPVLMAADILLLHPNKVIVGQDQKANVQLICDIIDRVNNRYKLNYDIDFEFCPTILGSDGEKMSCSLGNTFMLDDFTDENLFKKYINSYITYVRPNKESKGIAKKCLLFNLFLSVHDNTALMETIENKCMHGLIGCTECKNLIADLLLTDHNKNIVNRDGSEHYIHEALLTGAEWAIKRYHKCKILF